MAYRIVLEKEDFKFSCSHFTILGPGRAERLHGHNYHVRVELDIESLDPTLGMAFDFNSVKPLVRETLASFDEFVLLPEKSPHLTLEMKEDSVRAKFAAKVYEFPREDIKILPIVNVTSEELARQIHGLLRSAFQKKPEVGGFLRGFAVSIEETRGQRVVYHEIFR